MKSAIAALLVAVSAATLAGCTTTQQGAVGGAVAGAVAGQLIGGDTKSTLAGAAIGAVGGAVAGELVGRQANGQCVYQRADGSQFIAQCPS